MAGMRSYRYVAVMALLLGVSQGLAQAPAEKPVPGIDRVLIISIDGLRPDLLVLADAPRIRQLCCAGSYTFWAETTPEAYTLPCHVSMLTGTPSELHGVTWNDYIEQAYPQVPTLFEVAKAAGLKTAMAAGKMKFVVFTKPGALDTYYIPPKGPVPDREVVTHAEKLLRKLRPEVLFVHFGDVDSVGHASGWGSPEQRAAVKTADIAVGQLLDVVAELHLAESTLVILTADHGGTAKNHGADDPRSHFVPWIITGTGLKKNYDLTMVGDRTIRLEDTFATACAFLGLAPGKQCRGKPVLEALATRP